MEAGTPPLARRVFLVIVDGLRFDRSYELPFLDELRRGGVDAEASSHYPTWSRPNYVSILTGVPPIASGVRTNHHSTPVLLDTLMDRVRAAGMQAACATDYDVLPRLFLRWRSRPAEPTPIRSTPRPRTTGTISTRSRIPRRAWPCARPMRTCGRRSTTPATPRGQAASARPAPRSRPSDAELVVLLVGAVDAAGHRYGGDSPEYRAATEVADRALARVLAEVDLSHDAIVVTADHGHTARGGHGGIEPEVISVPLIAVGRGHRSPTRRRSTRA